MCSFSLYITVAIEFAGRFICTSLTDAASIVTVVDWEEASYPEIDTFGGYRSLLIASIESTHLQLSLVGSEGAEWIIDC